MPAPRCCRSRRPSPCRRARRTGTRCCASRAIETGCFVFAPAQVGTHKGSNRKTYGHSIAVAPWGEVLADAGGEKAGFVIAEVDLAKVEEARRMVPSLQHDRKYAAPVLHKAAVAKAAE